MRYLFILPLILFFGCATAPTPTLESLIRNSYEQGCIDNYMHSNTKFHEDEKVFNENIKSCINRASELNLGWVDGYSKDLEVVHTTNSVDDTGKRR